MPWYGFAIVAAMFTTAAAVTQKKALFKERALEFSATLAFFNALLSIPFFFFVDYSALDLSLLWIVLVSASFGAVAYLLIAKAARHMDISRVSPLMVMGPGFTAIIAFAFLGEQLTSMQIFGIALLIVGAYVLELQPNHGPLEPFRAFRGSKYIHFIMIALLLYALGSSVDRYLLGQRDMQITAYMAFVHPFLLIIYIIILKFFHGTSPGIRRGVKDAGWLVLLVAIFTMTHRTFNAVAMSVAFIGLVSAVKRSNALFTTIIGGGMFHERNLARKMGAAGVMIVGAISVVL